jgi:hypothetical protein
MNHLRAEFMRRVPSPDGPQADILIIEPTGEEHQVRCLCKSDGTTDLGIMGERERLAVLEEKYGHQVICALSRQTTLAHQ